MSLLRAHKPKHAKPSKAAPVLAVGGMTATLGAGLSAMAPSAQAADGDDFARLRMCESGNHYAANTGNGFYGAYQFDARTWHGLGYSALPSNASPSTQDAAANELQAQRGWQPWPGCSRKLSLGRDAAAPRASRSRFVVLPKATAGKAPGFNGHVLTTADIDTTRADVKAWQARMRTRGWDLSVDGRYGPCSAQVAARFAAEKRLHTMPGTVDHVLWTAAWQLPVS